MGRLRRGHRLDLCVSQAEARIAKLAEPLAGRHQATAYEFADFEAAVMPSASLQAAFQALRRRQAARR
jgi:hypothetical protein